MRSHLRFVSLALCGLTWIAVGARDVAADTVWANTTTNGGINSGYTGTVTGFGTYGLVSFQTRIASTSDGVAGATPIETYCIDITGNNSSAPPEQADLSYRNDVLNEGSQDQGNPAVRNIGAAGWVLKNYQDRTSTNWNSIGGGTLTNQQKVAIIQAAVWTVAFNTVVTINGSPDLNTALSQLLSNAKTSGTIGTTGAVYNTAYAGFLNYPPNGGLTTGGSNQDMVFATSVPEPGTYGIALSAVGMLIGARVLRRRSSRGA